ncbi:hypothetical protein BRADI_3g59835v3 [Brachypodium distachyon]|uniref:Uncharacterized protein n=1 Tax=Brachypodium distachyon TaxID=15368 RepID=A0A2K2D5W3_BRADI|nr:hypothetical protein BRADI_3g59835v3 [Brachypodium distachyon]
MSRMAGKKLVVAMLLVLVATSGLWARAAARPLQGDLQAGEPSSSGGSVNIVQLPSSPESHQWRVQMLPPFEEKYKPPCRDTHDQNNHCPPA